MARSFSNGVGEARQPVNLVGLLSSKWDPVGWWRLFGGDVPDLRRIAIAVLGMTTSSCPVERSFSLQKSIHTTARNRLNHGTVNKLVFCHSNMNLLWEGNTVDDDVVIEFIEAAVAATNEDDGVGSTIREQAGGEGAIQVGSDDEEDDEEERDDD
jgi:hAT family C-terminal dimerisation region